MAELPSPAQSSNASDDNLPIALRRVRRSCSTFNLKPADKTSRAATGVYGLDTPPATPQRRTKRVRFSDPGPVLAAANVSSSSGLTPFISRHSISSPRTQRRHSSGSVAGRSTSSKSRWNLDIDDSPISGTLQFAPLRQVLEGRVKRRIRRNRLSEELNSVEFEKREEKRAQAVKILQLQEELRAKDLELQALREDAEAAAQLGGVPATPESQAQAELLERSISELQSELNRSFSENASPVGSDESEVNWTLAAKDPWAEDAFMMEMETLQEDSEMVTSTPQRRQEQMRRSFPSPPDTVPNTPSRGPVAHVFMPVAPSSLRGNDVILFNCNLGLSATFAESLQGSHTGDTTIPNSPTLSATTEAATEREGEDHCMQLPAFQPPNYSTMDCGIQTSFSLLSRASPSPPTTNIILRQSKQIDAEAQAQIYDLTEELATLTETLEHNTTTQDRLAAKLGPWTTPIDASHTEALDFALDSVLTHLALAQESAHDHASRFDALTRELCALFPSAISSPSATEGGEHDASGAAAETVLNLLRDQFRSARLDLEYLFPGEQAEGFDNARLLSMLISRLKTLHSKTQTQTAEIEEYAEQEKSLKAQLSARVDAMKTLRDMLTAVQASVSKLEEENEGLVKEGREKDTSLDRLKTALSSYRAEVSRLESCIERLDSERAHIISEGRRQLDEMRDAAQHRIGQEVDISTSLRERTEEQYKMITDLETRLKAASEASQFLQHELQRLTESRAADGPSLKQFEDFRTQAYAAIRERDATIGSMHAELQTLTSVLANSQEEIERLREGLGRAHEAIAGEKRRGRVAMERMRGEVRRVVEEARGASGQSTPVREGVSAVREVVGRVPSTGFLQGVAMAREMEVDTSMHDAKVDTSMRDVGQSREDVAAAGLPAQAVVQPVNLEAKARVGHMFDTHLARRRRSHAVNSAVEEQDNGRRAKRRQTFGVGSRDDA